MGEGVPEGVRALGKQARLVEELGRLQVGEATVYRVLRYLGDGLQQRQGHLGADDCRGLQELFFLRRQPIDARGQHRLYRSRYLNTWERLGQAICSPLTDQHLRFYQSAHALLQEEGIALGACDQALCQQCQARIVPEEP